jgi:sugar O-acyltransferase (sialic acid O-acetyltransferase NeuD family)
MRNQHPLQDPHRSENIIIIGTGESAAVALDYLNYDTPHKVVGFSTEKEYLDSDAYCGLPAVPLDNISDAYPPGMHKAFVPVSPTGLNRLRRRLFDTVKAAGFTCISYVSSHAFVLPSVTIGENVFIQENTGLQYMTSVGDNVFLGSGSCVGHSSVIEEDCYIGPNASIAGNCRIGRSCFIGVNSTISNTVSVAEDCVIGAGAVVLKNTEPRHVYLGNPARPTGRDSFDTWPARSN